jgi:hypothetical protein
MTLSGVFSFAKTEKSWGIQKRFRVSTCQLGNLPHDVLGNCRQQHLGAMHIELYCIERV